MGTDFTQVVRWQPRLAVNANCSAETCPSDGKCSSDDSSGHSCSGNTNDPCPHDSSCPKD